MKTALPVVVALQLAYVIICLPVVGSSSQGKSKGPRKARPGEKNLKKGGAGGGGSSGGDAGGGNVYVVRLSHLFFYLLLTSTDDT